MRHRFHVGLSAILFAVVLLAQPAVLAGPAVGPAALALEAPDPLITEMLDQVEPSVLAGYVGDLSGENPVTIGDLTTTILTRYSGTPGMRDAAYYLQEHYQGLGLPTELWPYGTRDWMSVVATQAGVTYPDQVYILCAHYDSRSESSYVYAPGADDNASGASAVMLAAQILSQYVFDYTIRYINFSGEEQGLFGSYAYAHQSSVLEEQILGVINLDMIGWDSVGGPVFELHARGAESEEIAQVFAQAVDTYGLNLDLEILTDAQATDASDHAPFWSEGYPAMLAIEDMQDFNPGYHTTQDRLEALNFPYFTDAVKGAVAALAILAGPRTDSPPTPTPTPTATPWPTPACPPRLEDGGFEAGSSGSAWVAEPSGDYDLISTRNPHDGEWGAWLSQSTRTDDSLCQAITVPADASDATLDFWWQMWTDETQHAIPVGRLQVVFRAPATADVSVLMELTDGDLQHVWRRERIPLPSYPGQNTEVCFLSQSDGWVRTHFFIDDVQVTYCSASGPMDSQFWFPLLLRR